MHRWLEFTNTYAQGESKVQVEKRNVIWVASYPKSGNTWVHESLRTAGRSRGFPQGPMDIYDMINTGRRPEVCPAVREEFASVPASVLKTHNVFYEDQPLHVLDDMELETVGFIYIYRNPLDLLLSYINFTRLEYASNRDSPAYAQALFHEILGLPKVMTCDEWAATTLDDLPREALDHALGRFSERGLTLPTCFPKTPWSKHVEHWLAAAGKIPSVIVKYEDCLADKSTFNRMAKFFTFGETEIQNAVGSSGSRARKVLEDGTHAQRIFYNKMQAYYFPRYFSEPAVDRFVARHRDVLERFGYEAIVSGEFAKS